MARSRRCACTRTYPACARGRAGRAAARRCEGASAREQSVRAASGERRGPTVRRDDEDRRAPRGATQGSPARRTHTKIHDSRLILDLEAARDKGGLLQEDWIEHEHSGLDIRSRSSQSRREACPGRRCPRDHSCPGGTPGSAPAAAAVIPTRAAPAAAASSPQPSLPRAVRAPPRARHRCLQSCHGRGCARGGGRTAALDGGIDGELEDDDEPFVTAAAAAARAAAETAASMQSRCSTRLLRARARPHHCAAERRLETAVVIFTLNL